ncbi:hypothetical protein [Dactylosporangium sp. CA-139066]|uniref:hypothetical protein n=1 Tax=Dactylosporangium sp. CA-139066 TaxID=3239930 RepID=UPI003D8BA639
MSGFTPAAQDRFSCGLRTVGRTARDDFDEATRAPLDRVEAFERLNQPAMERLLGVR